MIEGLEILDDMYRATGKIDGWIAEGRAEGKAEGKAEGRAEGELAGARSILMHRAVITAAQGYLLRPSSFALIPPSSVDGRREHGLS